MSWRSAQNTNLTVNDLTVNGKLILTNDDDNDFVIPDEINVNKITSTDTTNVVDMTKANEIILDSTNVILQCSTATCHGALSMTNKAITNVLSISGDNGVLSVPDDNILKVDKITSNDSSNIIDMTKADDIILESTTVNLQCTNATCHGTLNMTNKSISNVSSIAGENGVLTVPNNNVLLVRGKADIDLCNVEGSYLDWNISAGKMNFVNNRGSNVNNGGFSFYNVQNDSSGNVDPATTSELVDINSIGNMWLKSETDSTAPNNGALVVVGGCGIEKNLHVGGNITVTGSITSTNQNTSEYHYIHLTGNDDNVSGTIMLNNPNGTTNYMAFPAIYYGYGGSGGAYGVYDTSSAINNIIISDITTSSFKYYLNKSNNDNVNVFISFQVVFSNELNFSKSYN